MNRYKPKNGTLSHRYKCVFVHIAKTGGTSIDKGVLFEDKRQEYSDKMLGGHRTVHELRELFSGEMRTYVGSHRRTLCTR